MLLLTASGAVADESPDDQPGMAFLEYLAELEKVEDGWLGPMDMEHQALAEHQTARGVITLDDEQSHKINREDSPVSTSQQTTGAEKQQ